MPEFDLARAVKEGCRTRDGRPVRILCTDRKSEFWPVIGLVEDEGQEHPTGFHTDGSAHCTRLDLVNLPEAHTAKLTLYRCTDGTWAADVWLDIAHGFKLGKPPTGSGAEDWQVWGKPVTVRIEHES